MEDQKKGTAPRPGNFESEFPGLVEKPQSTEPLGTQSEDSQSTINPGSGLYIASFLIPLVGFALGAAYISRRDDELGRNHIWAGFAGVIAEIFVLGCVIAQYIPR